jgi:hypothetical protein
VIQFCWIKRGSRCAGRLKISAGIAYISPESGVPTNHPLRKIRKLARDVLKELSWSFARLYAKEGRPSVPAEQLLSAVLIQVLYGIRPERQLREFGLQSAVSLVCRALPGLCGGAGSSLLRGRRVATTNVQR